MATDAALRKLYTMAQTDAAGQPSAETVAKLLSTLPAVKPEGFSPKGISKKNTFLYWFRRGLVFLVSFACVALILLNALSQGNGVFDPMKELFHLTSNTHWLLLASVITLAVVFFLAYLFPLVQKGKNFGYDYAGRKQQKLWLSVQGNIDALRATLPQKLSAQQIQAVVYMLAALEAEQRAQRTVVEQATNGSKWVDAVDTAVDTDDGKISPMWANLLNQYPAGSQPEMHAWLQKIAEASQLSGPDLVRVAQVEQGTVDWVRGLNQPDKHGRAVHTNGERSALIGKRLRLYRNVMAAQRAIAMAYLSAIPAKRKDVLEALQKAWLEQLSKRYGNDFPELKLNGNGDELRTMLAAQLSSLALYALQRKRAIWRVVCAILPSADRATREAVFAIIHDQAIAHWMKIRAGNGKGAGAKFGYISGLINAWIANAATIAFFGPGAIAVVYTAFGGHIAMVGTTFIVFIVLFALAGGLASHGLTKDSMVAVFKGAGKARDRQLRAKQYSWSVKPWWRAFKSGDWTVKWGVVLGVFNGVAIAFFGYYAGFGLLQHVSLGAAYASGIVVGVLTLFASGSLFVRFGIDLLGRMKRSVEQTRQNNKAWNRSPAQSGRQWLWMLAIAVVVIVTTAVQVWTFGFDLMHAFHFSLFSQVWAGLLALPAFIVFAGLFYDTCTTAAIKAGVLSAKQWQFADVDTKAGNQVVSSHELSDGGTQLKLADGSWQDVPPAPGEELAIAADGPAAS